MNFLGNYLVMSSDTGELHLIKTELLVEPSGERKSNIFRML
jgi:hypothetical protein